MKINTYILVFLFIKNFRSVFKENTNQFFYSEKISDLYLMKIQNSFFIQKKISDLYLMKIQIFFV